MSDEKSFVERRSGLTEEKVLLLINNSVTVQVAAMEERIVDAIDCKFEEKFRALDERISAVQDVFTDHIEQAFPDAPLEEHKSEHEARRRWKKMKERLGEDLLVWLVKGALTAILVILALGATEWVKHTVAK